MLRPKNKQSPSVNPIQAAVKEWLSTVPLFPTQNPNTLQTSTAASLRDVLVTSTPKRWVIYPPMLLLSSGSFGSPSWTALLSTVSPEQSSTLWTNVLTQVSLKSNHTLTHLAINEGIPLHHPVKPPQITNTATTTTITTASNSKRQQIQPKEPPTKPEENTLRTPTTLRLLHGSFGPILPPSNPPTPQDFQSAFWVSTTQNSIMQTWAPRHTMFSRGNIKEKARLLGFHDLPPHSPSKPIDDVNVTPDLLAHRSRTRQELRGKWAVDLYAGIGYFVFSYARLGMNVLCWEMNAWSVEGLRRAAGLNGWRVRVVQGEELGRRLDEVLKEEEKETRIVVLLEDNRHAGEKIRMMGERRGPLEVLHVNCGLLPRSDGSWRAALDALGPEGEGWLHLHENVGVEDIGRRKAGIETMFRAWCGEGLEGKTAVVEHVERVKTFAPGVWHCVFDVYIYIKPKEEVPFEVGGGL